jgi:fimbrial chaperone protein
LRKVEGFVSKKNVKRWLDHYQAIHTGDRIDDGRPVNSGPRPLDGVSGGRLNKIMLDNALADLKRDKPFIWRCVQCRWVKRVTRLEALQLLEVSSSEYAEGCREGLDYIFNHVNGGTTGYSKLLAAILGGN